MTADISTPEEIRTMAMTRRLDQMGLAMDIMEATAISETPYEKKNHTAKEAPFPGEFTTMRI